MGRAGVVGEVVAGEHIGLLDLAQDIEDEFPQLSTLVAERAERPSGPARRMARSAILAFLGNPDTRSEDIHSQARRTEREGGTVFSDPFDWARIIDASGGKPSKEDIDYMFLQRATRITESWGAFSNVLRLRFVDGKLLEFGHESASRNRVRTVFTALSQYRENRAYGFNVWRSLFEHKIKLDEEEMMRCAPIGTARVVISPCERSSYGKRLGMFPERSMAAVQISCKESDDTMVLHTFSLDRAELHILEQLLTEQGVEVASDARPEDYLAHIVHKHFNSPEELGAFKQNLIRRFDALVAMHHKHLKSYPRQGIVKEDARNLHTTAEAIIGTTEGQKALGQLYQLDARLARHVKGPAPLDPQVKKLAQQCLHVKRSDGSYLLDESDREIVRDLLCAKEVSIYDPQQSLALELIMHIHASGVEDSLRKALAGNDRALDWIVHGQLVVGEGALAATAAGAKAIEEGRGSGGCGGGAEVRTGLPDHKSNPDAYLQAKYGRAYNLRRGFCAACDSWGLLGPCDPGFCGKCDGEDSKHPGYIKQRMQNKRLARSAFALAV